MPKKEDKVTIFGGLSQGFEKAEAVFSKNLDLNPVYPFDVVSLNVYVFRRRSSSFVSGLCMLMVTLLITGLIYGLGGSINEYFLLPIVMISYSLYRTLYNLQWRTVVIYSNLRKYEFYVGKKLVYQGHIHNIYIRLKGMKTGGEDVIYNLVLDGFMLDEQELSGSTTMHDKMARLGRKLAYKLDINFFDYEDKSRGHVIRHRCPYNIQFRQSCIS